MISEQLRPDIDQAAQTTKYALSVARQQLMWEFPGRSPRPADCIALAAIIVTKLNMMQDCDMCYLEMDRADRRTPKDRSTK